METRDKTIVKHGQGDSGKRGYPTLNVFMDIDDGIYYCKVHLSENHIEYGLMSVISKYAEIHMLYAENKDYYDIAITVNSIKKIDRELIINAAMHLYGDEIIKRLSVKYE